MKSLLQLLAHVTGVETSGVPDISITGVTADSREVKPGSLFVAIKGTHTDATKFIEDALAKGAAAVVQEGTGELANWRTGEKDAGEMPVRQFAGSPVLRVPNARLALSQLAAAWYDGQPGHIAAITGTDGKTSTADFFRQLCALAGHRSASIGTLGVIGGSREYPVLNTTPGPLLLHCALSELAAEGVDYVALEAASHGLDQYRMHGVQVAAAAFTNLSRDHLDYHGTMEHYLAAKLKLFSEVLEKGGAAIANADDASFNSVVRACEVRRCEVLSYGRAGKHYRIDMVSPRPHGIDVKATLHGRSYDFTLPMIGTFQVMNLLAAIGLAEACGIALDKLLAAIPRLVPVPGRLELAATLQNGAPVFVDYAHTPAALRNILAVARPHIKGKLGVVFGCGGDRDKGKRPEMGKAALELADFAIVTDDNPRSEDPATIRREILAPLSAADLAKVQNIGDRKEAIRQAIGALQKGDGLVIAGKGHEKYQIYADRTIAFDDVAVARETIKQ